MKLDLHVHSQASPDSTLTISDYSKAFSEGKVDQIAITDHDEINYAKKAQKELGEDRIIVGEEITTKDGSHLIGLFISKFIPTGLSLKRTAQLIKNQNGLVYVPHPFSKNNGMGESALEELRKYKLVDIVEEFNGWERFVFPISMKGSKKSNAKALSYLEEYEIASVAASDAHVYSDLGNGHVELDEPVTRENIMKKIGGEKITYQKKYNSIGLKHFRAGLKYFWKKIPVIGG